MRCAVAIQDALKDQKDFLLRIGVHIGDVVAEGGDVIGSGVNVASRIVQFAQPDGVVVSGDVWRLASNQADLNATALGPRQLTGASEPIEVFELETGLTKPRRIPIHRDLIARRFPQITVLYFAAAWLIVEGVKWYVNRHIMSPHLIDLSFVVTPSFTPTVLILAYSRNTGTNIVKWGLSANVIASAIIVGTLFGGKDLGAATRTVTAVDEEGKRIERVIPKTGFLKKVVLFDFENASGDSTLNWLQYGITDLVHIDVLQDVFVDATPIGYMVLPRWGTGAYEQMKEAGYPGAVGLPLTLMTKLAGEWRQEYFLSGSFTKQNDDFSVRTELRETKTSKLIAENTFEGKDIFRLADELSLQLKRDLGVPAPTSKSSGTFRCQSL